jgi:hypothetical protein
LKGESNGLTLCHLVSRVAAEKPSGSVIVLLSQGYFHYCSTSSAVTILDSFTLSWLPMAEMSPSSQTIIFITIYHFDLFTHQDPSNA